MKAEKPTNLKPESLKFGILSLFFFCVTRLMFPASEVQHRCAVSCVCLVPDGARDENVLD